MTKINWRDVFWITLILLAIYGLGAWVLAFGKDHTRIIEQVLDSYNQLGLCILAFLVGCGILTIIVLALPEIFKLWDTVRGVDPNIRYKNRLE